MIAIESKVTGLQRQLQELEEKLKPLGYDIGSNWDYDHGYFDYKMADTGSYLFLRVPFTAVDGQLDKNGAVVELKEPFLLSHKYNRGLDDHVDVSNVTASIDQFSEPVDKDATFPKEWIDNGQALVKELEDVLLT
ncbi:YugN-like family protein [Bacillus taeanensis]|uniref:YugN-like family protein n=1 Tax=Bacillus taeanensis TaxID=273032 RepID=A0A366XY63_9BACI|nr:YugN-like family protein [Bacillus taeanensis]RBW71350.1 hypothetical protein DS031_00945 [Bacillus taeanensis]